MFRFSFLFLTLSFLVSQSWTCGSSSQRTTESVNDENFLVEDPPTGLTQDEDYEDYEHSIGVHRTADRVIHCRIEVLTVSGHTNRCNLVNCNAFQSPLIAMFSIYLQCKKVL